MLRSSQKQNNESNSKKYDDEPHNDAHDVLLYRHTLLPNAEDLIVVFITILKVPLVSHPKGLFLFNLNLFQILNSKILK